MNPDTNHCMLLISCQILEMDWRYLASHGMQITCSPSFQFRSTCHSRYEHPHVGTLYIKNYGIPVRYSYEMRCAIWYHLYNLKNTHGGVFLWLVKLPAQIYNCTKSDTPPWVFFTFFKLKKWYQIAQRPTYVWQLKRVKQKFLEGHQTTQVKPTGQWEGYI